MRSSMKWINIGVVFMISVVLVLAGCSSNQSSKTTDKTNTAGEKETNNGPKVLKVAIPGNATHLDPAFSSSGPDRTVNQPIYNGLVRFQPGTTDVTAIEGDLAEKWENNPEGTIWTFHLRQGVQWQFDYGEFTSADVKYTFDRLLDPKTGSAFTEDLSVIKEIQTPDQYTVVFQLKQPDPIFLQRLLVDDISGAIVKKEAIEAAGKDSMVKPVGTGPFMLKEYKLNEKVVLEKNPKYFRGEPKLDEIEFVTMADQNAVDIAMEKGEIQLATGSGDKLWLENMNSKKDIKIDYPGPPINWLLHLNSSIKPLDDIRVREAIGHAIDMSKYLKIVGPGVAKLASGPIASNLDGHADLGVYKYDPELSKKLLKEAGYPDGLELPPNFVNTRPVYLNMMTYIQEQLRQVGIKMELKQADIPTYQANIRKGLNNIVLKAGTFKSASFAFSDFVSTSIGSNNYSHYNKSDDLIVQANQEMDDKKAKEMYADIQKQIMDDFAVVPLMETNNVLFRRAEVNLGYDIEGTFVYSYPIYEMTDLQ